MISLKRNTNKKTPAHRYKEQIGASSGGDEGLAKGWKGHKVQTSSCNSLQAPMLGNLRPNNQQGKNTALPISRQAAYKVFLSPQPALPTRGTRPSSNHQWVGTSPSHQEACKSLLDQPHPPGADGRSKNHHPAHRNHNYRKSDRMRQQKDMLQMKKHDKSPEEQLSGVESGNLLQKEFRVMIVKMF